MLGTTAFNIRNWIIRFLNYFCITRIALHSRLYLTLFFFISFYLSLPLSSALSFSLEIKYLRCAILMRLQGFYLKCLDKKQYKISKIPNNPCLFFSTQFNLSLFNHAVILTRLFTRNFRIRFIMAKPLSDHSFSDLIEKRFLVLSHLELMGDIVSLAGISNILSNI